MTTRSFPFALALVTPTLCGIAVLLKGPFLLLPPFYLFVFTPIMDLVLGKSTKPLEPEEAAEKWRDLRYDIWLWLWMPLQVIVQGIGLYMAARTQDPIELVGLIFASGLLGGIGINVAHEFMHRKGRAERAAAEVILTTVSYAHFSIEHVLGHHKNVATKNDPASAAKGELLYTFLPRSIYKSVLSAWALETARVEKLKVPFGLSDRRLRYPLFLALLIIGVTLTGGLGGLIYFLGQSLVAIVLLETINYLEHYGLSRKELSNGAFERVQPEHSWNSAHRLTNWYLFQLPRHADHHAQASRPYFALRHLPEGPQLPAGYGTMLMAAFVPPLWFAVMDPRVEAWKARVSA